MSGVLEPRGDIEALLAEAHRRVEQRALEREAAAARRVREVLADADAAAEGTLERQRQRARTDAAELRKRVLARGEMSAQRAMLERREALLDEVWRSAEHRLAALRADPDAYLASLRALARLASGALAAPEVELASDAAGSTLLTAERLAAWGEEDGVRYRLAHDPLTAGTGLEGRAGRLRFDATFETRLQQARARLRERVAARLAEAAPPAPPAGERSAAT